MSVCLSKKSENNVGQSVRQKKVINLYLYNQTSRRWSQCSRRPRRRRRRRRKTSIACSNSTTKRRRRRPGFRSGKHRRRRKSFRRPGFRSGNHRRPKSFRGGSRPLRRRRRKKCLSDLRPESLSASRRKKVEHICSQVTEVK